VAAVLSLGGLAACRSTGPPDLPKVAPTVGSARLPDPLATYRQLGFLVGDRLRAVGKFVYLPGPADSTYAILAISLPNSALRFRRDPPGFVARYRVDVVVGDSAAPVARLSEPQEVRVRTFRETSRRGESVVYQGFMRLAPGDYHATVKMTDQLSSISTSAVAELHVPAFVPPSVTAPIVVYQAQPRANRATPPSLIISPRATVEFSNPPELQVYVEALTDSADALVIQVTEGGEVLVSDTLPVSPGEGPLTSALTRLAGGSIAPGAPGLQSRLLAGGGRASATLVVALFGDWLVSDTDEAISYLRYAGIAADLDSLRQAAPGERARRLHAFWKKRDPNPETPENEFFDRYFRRLREANDRFSNASTAGWLTDRAAVYVSLGPPDLVIRDLDARQRPERSQVWVYKESLSFELRLVFVDQTGAGTFGLTSESRRAFLEAVHSLYPE
jgi:GWxTD domain-containing protein